MPCMMRHPGSGATLFIEPMAVVNLNNDIKRYLAQEQEEIKKLCDRYIYGYEELE